MSSFIGTRKQLIEKYGSFIKKAVKGTGIYPGTLITQLIVESSGSVNGKNLVGGSGLSRNANNYFGIKATSNYKGAKYCTKTKEVINGSTILIDDCFRKYYSIEDSIKDYIQFLQNNQRYTKGGVFNSVSVEDQFRNLQKSGYATNPNYANFLISVYKPLKKDIDSIKGTKFNIDQLFTVGSVLLIVFSMYKYYFKDEKRN